MAAKTKTVKKVKKVVKKETIDFRYDKWDDLTDDFLELKRTQFTTVSAYLKTGMSVHSLHGDPLLVSSGASPTLFVLHDSRLYSVGHWRQIPCSNAYMLEFDGTPRPNKNGSHKSWASMSEYFSGLLIPSKKGYKFFLVQQADDEDSSVEMAKEETNHCSMSIECLSELLKHDARKSEQRIADLISGKTKIIDSTRDETRKPTAKVLAVVKKHHDMTKTRREVIPPESGFTLIGSSKGAQWHRSGTVLLTHEEKSYLLGQDDDAYFGCELADNPKTVSEAFLSLTPPLARKKAGVLRHGEWFLVPDNKVPEIEKCLAEFQEIDLPRDHPDSAIHRLRECRDGRISKDGVIFVQGGAIHHMEDDHDDIDLPRDKWFQCVRNTAIRSVSTEGVD